jgi:hypothetical protein
LSLSDLACDRFRKPSLHRFQLFAAPCADFIARFRFCTTRIVRWPCLATLTLVLLVHDLLPLEHIPKLNGSEHVPASAISARRSDHQRWTELCISRAPLYPVGMPPIALTDAQLTAVFEAARPLAVQDRDPFLQDVARAIRTVQRKHFDPPRLDHEPRLGRTVAR